MNEAQVKIARWISVIGHPFLLMPVLTGIVASHVLPPDHALIAVVVALVVVIIPSSLYTLVQVRRGTWGDLDVSHQRHRSEFYAVLLPLLFLVTIIAWIADVPAAIPFGLFAISLLVGAALLVNSRVKVSLHTGFGVFVASTLFLVKPGIASAALILACLVAWSRVVLGRHTTREVLLGGGMGLIVAGILAFTLKFF